MAERKPLVSIVICTYNGGKFLQQQLDSLVRQTYRELEILISDDRSSDNSLSIASNFAARDSRVRVHVNEENLGYNRNFEKAFYRASGEFIAVCDQDDIWNLSKIEKMLRLFTGEHVLLAHCQSVRFTNEIPEVEKNVARRPYEGSDPRKLMFFNTISGHNIMFRKKLLQHGPFPADVFYDWWLAIMAATYGTVNATVDVLTYHRYHDSNLTLGKKDEGKQTRNKAGERLHTLNAILQMKNLKPSDRNFAMELKNALSTLHNRKFSFTLFSFLTRNAGIIFFFKKKSFFSKLKMAYRMSFAIS